MKIPWLLFGLLLAMCVVVAGLFILDETPPGRTAGFEHDRFPEMDQGGPGQERHAPVFWLAWSFAALQTAFLVVCLALGVPPGVRRRRVTGPLIIGGVLFVSVVTMMFVSYQQYLVEDSPALVFSFPATTAWYLYGFWPIQLFFVVLYVSAFSRTFVTADDRTAFQKILATRRQPDDGHP
jgi:hypothetical protein